MYGTIYSRRILREGGDTEVVNDPFRRAGSSARTIANSLLSLSDMQLADPANLPGDERFPREKMEILLLEEGTAESVFPGQRNALAFRSRRAHNAIIITRLTVKVSPVLERMNFRNDKANFPAPRQVPH